MTRLFAVWLAMLLILSACTKPEETTVTEEKKLPQIEDIDSNGVKWGNSLAAEQGAWVALRGEHEGKVGLMLYNKNDETATFLQEGDVCKIGLLGNKIYYQLMEENTLYYYDLKTQKSVKFLDNCLSYQVRAGCLYYLTTTHGGRLEYLDLVTLENHVVATSFKPNDFWLTDRGIYYSYDAEGMLWFIPYDADQEQLIYQNKNAAAEDVIAVGEEQIAFLAKEESGQRTLLSYHHSKNKLKRHLMLDFSHLNYADGYVVTVESGSHIYALDIASDQVYDWGMVEEHHYPQILSDCLILYQGNQPVFQYYPTL